MGKTKEKATHPIRDQIEMILFAIVMALGLKVFALEAYEIPTGSMQPTLMGCDLLDARTGQATTSGIHDRVLVDKTLFLTRDPERWEVCVFRYPLATSNNYVKRLVGMPGEELWVQQGDIWARDSIAQGDFKIQRKPWSVQQHLWKRVYPSATVEPAQWSGWHTVGQFTRDEAGLLDLTGRCSIETRATIRDEYRHGYPDKVAMQIPVAGAGGRSRHPVSDLRATFRFTPLAGAGDLAFELDYGHYGLTLAFDAAAAQWVLRSGDTILAESDWGFEIGKEIEIDLAFWDHHIRLDINDGDFLFDTDLDLPAKSVTRNGMRIHSSSGGWQLQPGEIWRDIHYISPLNGGTPL
ncbi:MAG: signal peptidase I, partial [Planctomycetes bacterium]|nr:signal peptidase I [Planctomycetota bacterium]